MSAAIKKKGLVGALLGGITNKNNRRATPHRTSPGGRSGGNNSRSPSGNKTPD